MRLGRRSSHAVAYVNIFTYVSELWLDTLTTDSDYDDIGHDDSTINIGVCVLFMAALCNRAGHIYFHPVVSFFLFSSPNLSGQRLDVYHTSTHGVALV